MFFLTACKRFKYIMKRNCQLFFVESINGIRIIDGPTTAQQRSQVIDRRALLFCTMLQLQLQNHQEENNMLLHPRVASKRLGAAFRERNVNIYTKFHGFSNDQTQILSKLWKVKNICQTGLWNKFAITRHLVNRKNNIPRTRTNDTHITNIFARWNKDRATLLMSRRRRPHQSTMTRRLSCEKQHDYLRN